MGNSSFSGAIRSKGGFKHLAVATATGVETEINIVDTNGILAATGNVLATEAGTGITTGTGTVYASSVVEVGGIITTKILIDITGLRGTTAEDIVGVDGTALPCHFGQITAAKNGTILTGTMLCLEVPVGSLIDTNIYSAVEATGVEDAAISTLDETLLLNGAAQTLGKLSIFEAVPAADEYLYLTVGTTVAAANATAGKYLITLTGYRA